MVNLKLPGLEEAYVPKEKITNYLLDVDHESGRGKALFFMHFGFSVEKWEELAQAFSDHAREHEIVSQESTRFGTRYVIEGALNTPIQRMPQVRVVWFIPNDSRVPRLATAYPLEEPND